MKRKSFEENVIKIAFLLKRKEYKAVATCFYAYVYTLNEKVIIIQSMEKEKN